MRSSCPGQGWPTHFHSGQGARRRKWRWLPGQRVNENLEASRRLDGEAHRKQTLGEAVASMPVISRLWFTLFREFALFKVEFLREGTQLWCWLLTALLFPFRQENVD